MQTFEFISCLFVKFVLYTAGFLGEGTLLIYINLYRFVLIVIILTDCVVFFRNLGAVLTKLYNY